MIVAAERIAVQLPQARRKICQNATDLVREAVGWNGGLGELANDARLLPACPHHAGTQSRLHNGRSMESPQAHDHAEHNGQSAPRAIEPRLHNGHRHDEHRHNGRPHPRSAHVIEKR